jgi:cobalt/nickel transport system ATP-binding protein
MNPLIAVRGLSYRYEGGTQALRDVDFSLFPGEAVALLGPNGSGKSTFVMHLNGLLEGSGTIDVCGIRLTSATASQIRQRVGVVFQDSDNQLFMPTVLEDVAFGPLNLGLSTAEAEARARECLREVGMDFAAGRAPYHLSAGEKKRVAIAGILAMRPDILVLDEPTTYLDPPGQRALVELLQQLPQAKILVTHDVHFALALSTRAVFFQNGCIVGEGPPDEVITRFGWTHSH